MWRDQLIRLFPHITWAKVFWSKNKLTNISSGANPLRPVHRPMESLSPRMVFRRIPRTDTCMVRMNAVG